MHVGIDHAGEGKLAFAIMGFAGACHVNAWRHQRELAVFDGDVAPMHHVAVGAHNAHVFDEEVKFGLAHGGSFWILESGVRWWL